MPGWSQPIQNVPPGTQTMPSGAGPGGSGGFRGNAVAGAADPEGGGGAGAGVGEAQPARMAVATAPRTMRTFMGGTSISSCGAR
jgi:hypothetical protein